MTEIENKPILSLYPEFAEEWDGFSPEMKAELAQFLERLQADPYDPQIMENSEKHGEYFGSRIGSLRVYWKLKFKDGPIGIFAKPERIYILAVERAEKRREKRRG